MTRTAAASLLGLVFWAGNSLGADAPAALQGSVVKLQTPEGIGFGIWGTKATWPAPTLFIFSATIDESLGNPYFRQCGNALAEGGFLCVSLDLPGHGSDRRQEEPEGLNAWRVRSDRGEDFITPFSQRAREVLDYLIEAGYTDPGRIAACGTSRGGFMALQLAAVEPRIRATAGFAPVTALATLREFHGATDADHAEALSLHARAEALAGRSLWLVIGDRDQRVGTDETIALARQVTKLSLAQAKPADVTLIVLPEPKGHTTPGPAPAMAAAWIAEKLNGL